MPPKNKKKKKKKAVGQESKASSPFDNIKLVKLGAIPTAASDGSLVKKVNSNQDKFAFFLAHHKEAGRMAVANRELAPGTLLLREEGFPWIVHRSYLASVCHHCAQPIAGGKSARLACSTCKRAVF